MDLYGHNFNIRKLNKCFWVRNLNSFTDICTHIYCGITLSCRWNHFSGRTDWLSACVPRCTVATSEWTDGTYRSDRTQMLRLFQSAQVRILFVEHYQPLFQPSIVGLDTGSAFSPSLNSMMVSFSIFVNLIIVNFHTALPQYDSK